MIPYQRPKTNKTIPKCTADDIFVRLPAGLFTLGNTGVFYHRLTSAHSVYILAPLFFHNLGIYKRKQESKTTRKQELDQESDQENKNSTKKTRKQERK